MLQSMCNVLRYWLLYGEAVEIGSHLLGPIICTLIIPYYKSSAHSLQSLFKASNKCVGSPDEAVYDIDQLVRFNNRSSVLAQSSHKRVTKVALFIRPATQLLISNNQLDLTILHGIAKQMCCQLCNANRDYKNDHSIKWPQASHSTKVCFKLQLIGTLQVSNVTCL